MVGILFKLAYAFGFIGILINGASLFLLEKSKRAKMDKTQRWIIINICISNICLSIFWTVTNTIVLVKGDRAVIQFGDFHGRFIENETYDDYIYSIYENDDVASYVNEEGIHVGMRFIIQDSINAIFFVGTYIATIWLVLDRYLHLKFMLKYALLWSQKKTVITTLVMWILSVLIGSLMRIFLRRDLSHICNYIHILFDLIVVFFSTYVYAYALILSKKQIKTFYSNQTNKSITKGLMLSVTILMTFMVTVTVPDIFQVINKNHDLSTNTAWFVLLCQYISLLTDAFIYILLSPQVRQYCNIKFTFLRKTNSATVAKARTIHISKSYINSNYL